MKITLKDKIILNEILELIVAEFRRQIEQNLIEEGI